MHPPAVSEPSTPDNADQAEGFDVVVVGAGFAGMYMLHRLRQQGLRVRVVEAGSGVGGTWYWNRYPGARCDVESMQYSYQFDEALQQEWEWTERYAAQPEILRYANHVADRFALRRDIDFNTRVSKAIFDESTKSWALTTSDGRHYSSRFVVMATGCLSAPNRPKLEGLESFKGAIYHTGEWPHEGVDFTGKRVAVIGTGSSAVQSIPLIAEQAKQLTIFQRTAHWVVPAHNGPMDPDVQRSWKADYPAKRAAAKSLPTGVLFDYSTERALETPADARNKEYERRWQRGGTTFIGAYTDLLVDADANKTAADFVAAKIREAVPDPALAEKLTPNIIIGCKRLIIDTGYYATFSKPHVELVDISKAGIGAITPTGVRANGREWKIDALVIATGFDAMTGALARIDIRGRNGLALADAWREGPKSYLGLAVAGFPNLFTITGPGSPSVLTNMLPSIEQHVEWVSDCIAYLDAHGIATIDAQADAQEAWVAHVRDVAGLSLRSTCSSWYVGANVPGKPRVFMPYIGGFPRYVERVNEIASRGYEGFTLARAA
jgi:cyclohexanone monooxygenase